MRFAYYGLILAIATPAVFAQTRTDFDMCNAKDDPDSTIAGCTAVIAAGNLSPTDAAATYALRGFAYFAEGHYDKAAMDFTTVISDEPSDGGHYAARGYAYEKGGQVDKAIADYRKALTLASPTSPEASAARTRLKVLGVMP